MPRRSPTTSAVWFGKDRSGEPNVITGANPKVEGLETAWAIEAPDAKTAAIVLSDGKTLPLTHIDGTPIFAATLPLAAGSAFRWTYVTDGNKEGRKGQLEVYTDAPELTEMPGVPKGKLTQQKPWESKIFPRDQARVVGLCPGSIQPTTGPRASWSFRMAAATRASCPPSSTT